MKERHPEIEWKLIAGMRNRIAHGYFSLDPDTIWTTLVANVPELRKQIAEVIATEFPAFPA